MKLKDTFITYKTGDEMIMVGVGCDSFNGLLRINRTAAFIVDCLKNDVTEEYIIAEMLKRYDVDETVLSNDVKCIIEKLRLVGALTVE